MKYKKVEFAPRVGVEQHEDIAEDGEFLAIHL